MNSDKIKLFLPKYPLDSWIIILFVYQLKNLYILRVSQTHLYIDNTTQLLNFFEEVSPSLIYLWYWLFLLFGRLASAIRLTLPLLICNLQDTINLASSASIKSEED